MSPSPQWRGGARRGSFWRVAGADHDPRDLTAGPLTFGDFGTLCGGKNRTLNYFARGVPLGLPLGSPLGSFLRAGPLGPDAQMARKLGLWAPKGPNGPQRAPTGPNRPHHGRARTKGNSAFVVTFHLSSKSSKGLKGPSGPSKAPQKGFSEPLFKG
jgi:hypothetical protein